MIKERLKVLLLDENALSLFGDQIRQLNDGIVSVNMTTFVMIQFMKSLVKIFIHVRLKPHFARYRNKLLKTYNYILNLRKPYFQSIGFSPFLSRTSLFTALRPLISNFETKSWKTRNENIIAKNIRLNIIQRFIQRRERGKTMNSLTFAS